MFGEKFNFDGAFSMVYTDEIRIFTFFGKY